MSKIKIIDVELISGYDRSQFEWVKQSVRIKFISVKKTADIEWLESEDSIKEIRKQKLQKLDELLKK